MFDSPCRRCDVNPTTALRSTNRTRSVDSLNTVYQFGYCTACAAGERCLQPVPVLCAVASAPGMVPWSSGRGREVPSAVCSLMSVVSSVCRVHRVLTLLSTVHVLVSPIALYCARGVLPLPQLRGRGRARPVPRACVRPGQTEHACCSWRCCCWVVLGRASDRRPRTRDFRLTKWIILNEKRADNGRKM